jgi:hypothetical protein
MTYPELHEHLIPDEHIEVIPVPENHNHLVVEKPHLQLEPLPTDEQEWQALEQEAIDPKIHWAEHIIKFMIAGIILYGLCKYL